MALPTITETIEVAGVRQRGSIDIELVASTAGAAFAYTNAGEPLTVGGKRTIGLVDGKWSAQLNPNSGSSDDAIAAPENTVYRITYRLSGSNQIAPVYITAPDDADEHQVATRLTNEPTNLGQSIADLVATGLDEIADAVDDGITAVGSGSGLIPLTQKGANSGVATLDSGGQIPRLQRKHPDYINVLEYGVAGDGSTNDLTTILSLATTYGATKTLRFPRARYALGIAGAGVANRITLPSGARVVCDPGAIFMPEDLDWQSGASLFYASGTDSAKTNMPGNTAAGAQTLTLASGHGANFAWGDLIGIEAATAVGIATDGVSPFYARELRRVVAVDGDEVELDAPLEYAYATADTAQFWRVTPVRDISIEGAVFESGAGVLAEELGSYAITLAKSLNCRLDGIELHQMTGGVRLHDAYDTTVNDLTIDSLQRYELAYGDGLILGGSTTRTEVKGIHGRDTRHIVTTLSDERSGPTYWGGPVHATISNGIGYGAINGYSIWDTHEFGRHLHLDNLQAHGGGAAVTGFQIRAQDVQLTNCRAIRCGLQGVAARHNSRNVQILGGEFAYNGQNGVSLNGADGRVDGARIHHNVASGVTVAHANAVDNRITNCKIYENQYGITDGNVATRTTIQGCEIPKSTTQTVAIVQPGATTTILGGSHFGYGASNSGMTSFTSGCKVIGLATDTAIINTLGTNPGSAGGSPSYNELLYRGGASILRTDATFRTPTVNVGGTATISAGSGTPEGSVTAPVGSLYLRTGGGAATSIYVKESGTGNTGWVAK